MLSLDATTLSTMSGLLISWRMLLKRISEEPVTPLRMLARVVAIAPEASSTPLAHLALRIVEWLLMMRQLLRFLTLINLLL